MRRIAGFTLLELLIGLTLLGIMLTLLFGGFRLALRSWDALEMRLHAGMDEHVALGLVRRLASSTQPLRSNHQPGQPLIFVGQPDRLVMVATLTESLGLRLIEISIVPRQDRLQLVLHESPLRYGRESLLTDTVAEAQPRVLIDNLQSAEFGFFGAPRINEVPGWYPHWDPADQFPTLVRLRLTPKGGGTFDFMVATMVSADRMARERITASPP